MAACELLFKAWSCYLTMATPIVTILNFGAMCVASDKLMCIANVRRESGWCYAMLRIVRAPQLCYLTRSCWVGCTCPECCWCAGCDG